MDKETSGRVSSIAARLNHLTGDAVCVLVHRHDAGPEAADANSPTLESFVDDVQTLAGSCMSQDQTPGQMAPAGDFYSRLKDEHRDLERRVLALNSYLTHNPGHPNPRHAAMLERQAAFMSEYLAVLGERIGDIDISRRSAPVEEIEELDDDDGA